jgi:glycosyltransferase involved in cell wall biosynthesis
MTEIRKPKGIVSVIVPAFNEKESLEELFTRVNNVFRQLDTTFEFIVIDDGSSDGTYEMLKEMRKAHPNIAMIRHYKNFGKSLALMQGFDMACGNVAITLDADLQDQPELIPDFLAKLEDGYDMVNGCRQGRKDTAAKRMVSKIYNKLVHLIFGYSFRDVNCGFKAYKRSAFDWLDLRGDLHRLIPVLVASKGLRVTEIPVPHKDRKHGKSKYKLFRHRGLLDLLALAVSQTTQVRPFHFFCELSALFWTAAVASFFVWVASTGTISSSLEVLIAIFGLWFVFVGTILPIFGFYLEISSYQNQGLKWRGKLIRDQISSDL